ncbi:predicted N6-adenine-specific DNA methylase [Geomicrobium sp. JCM 19037]|uniref:THUMP domain-containing class I SAM-dependent RNA methyltransferase n=1 Tax=Geomicrobium sp. JCM 19037 TaxID=1460634 RepID=UPI00045F1872|nr:class I SAM-dependent RNA methyltransferase [Geomicrobium sp. JCM 19037]GAK01866.1 predicted N6-adenine-specific DNA methylase [Geomicrobium sp. JCM 19037]
MSKTYTYIATATMGLESIVAKEIQALGYDTEVENGKVMFEGPIEAMIEANLWLRTSDRVKLVIGKFHTDTFDDLFEQTKAMPWEEFIPVYGEFPVDGRSVKSTLFSISDCQRIVKKAIVERLKQTYNQDWFQEEGPQFKIEVALLKDEATLTIDTSGEGLHKRGYRYLHSMAPLKETLAAALIKLTNWRYDQVLVDPFCGSGTIPIEAALMAKNIAPGLYRNFASEQWSWVPEQAWSEARAKAKEKINDRDVHIYGFDKDPEMVKLSENNAELAHVPEIRFSRSAVDQLPAIDGRGVLVMNPPYGTRLEDEKAVQKIYSQLGTRVREAYDDWSVYVLTANEQFESLYGADATKKRKLYNGNIKTDYYQYWAKRKR